MGTAHHLLTNCHGISAENDYDIVLETTYNVFILRLLKPIVRIALLLLVLGYFTAAAVMLFTRYWVLPRIDQWRPAIEQVVSESVGTPVQIAQISAQWQSLNVALQLNDIKISDQEGAPGLLIPSAEAIVSWRSLMRLKPIFKYIGVDGFNLTVSRQGKSEYKVAGFNLDAAGAADASAIDRLLNWTALQSRINFTNATLTWTDAFADTPAVAITGIDLTLNNRLLTHELSVQAQLPPTLGQTVSLAIQSTRQRGSILGQVVQTADTKIYVALPQLSMRRLSDWFDVPAPHGTFGGQAWLTLRDRQVDWLTIDVAARDASDGDRHGIDGVEPAWHFDSGQARVDGPIALFLPQATKRAWMTKALANSQLNVVLSAKNLVMTDVSADFERVSIDDGKLKAAIKRPSEEALTVVVDVLEAANRDGALALSGQWSRDQADRPGNMDFTGTLDRIQLASLSNYLAGVIGTAEIEWMGKAFKKGAITKAGFKIKGPVDTFPYENMSSAGIFRVDGTFEDFTLDYVPVDSADELAWPLLVDLKGTISMISDRISIKAAGGALQMPDEQRIAVNRLTADIIDLETVPVIMLNAGTEGSANSYASAFTTTALKSLVPPFVAELSGTGQWSLPLTLQVNLDDVQATTLSAELNLNGGTISYADVPPVTVTGGTAVFSESGFAAKQLVGTWLGGEVSVSGAIDEARHTLQAQGALAWPELAKYTGSVVLKDWFVGQLPYQFVLTAEPKKPHEIKVESSLLGTEIKLPAPFGKTRQSARPMTLTWKEGVAPAADSFALSLGTSFAAQGRLSPANAPARVAVIDAATVTIGDLSAARSSINPAAGLAVSARLDHVDGEQWREAAITLQKEMAAPIKGRPFLAPLRQADFEASTFKWDHTVLEALDMSLALTPSGDNKFTLKSDQTAGTVRWQSKAGKIDSRLVAHFTKLNIGTQKTKLTEEEKIAARSSLPKEDTLSKVPALDLTVDEFTLFGSQLGRLVIVGENAPDHTEWKINKLQISNPNGEVTAAGTWQFSPKPGISVAAAFKVSDLGIMSADLGLGDRLHKGAGSVTAKVDWGDFPWRTDYDKLDAQVAIDLKDGSFAGVNSRSARVLALLSLQSLNRLFSVNVTGNSPFEDGFPWQTIRGDLSINQGVIDTRNLRVNSTVAIISIAGGSNLVDETFKLDARVRPNLDMSGAAIATGFVVNPLVGLGALVGQYLLKIPVEKALSVDYQVTGTWDQPLINGEGGAVQDSMGVQHNGDGVDVPVDVEKAPLFDSGAAAPAKPAFLAKTLRCNEIRCWQARKQ